MEIYRNSVSEVAFKLPVVSADIVPTAEVKPVWGDMRELSWTMPTGVDNDPYAVAVTLGLEDTIYNGSIRIRFTTGSGMPLDYFVNVATPYFTKESLNDPDFDDVDLPKLESLVRQIIDSYTGQNFGLWYGRRRAVKGSTGEYTTGKRILTIDKTEGLPSSVNYSGAPITFFPWTYHDVKADIVMPSSQYNPFRRSGPERRAYVTGEYGYYYVPEDVQQAARILAEEFGCDESLWRDRYLVSMKSSDWRVQYSPLAYFGTGSVNADQLLEKYIVAGPVVV